MLFSNRPPSCWDVSAAPWCPSINLGKLPGEQPPPQPAPPAPSRHVPPLSAHCPGLPMRLSQCLHWPPCTHPSSLPSLAAVASPSPQALPRWFPRKGRGRNTASKPPEVRALGEFFSLPNQFPSRFIYFSHPTPGTHASQAHTPGSRIHSGSSQAGRSYLLVMPH